MIDFATPTMIAPGNPASAAPATFTEPECIEVRGARVHNLKNLSLKVPLRQLVGIAGVSGSGKSSLALGVLYAEGSRRYLEALSTYTRRRISQTGRADVDEVLHVPAALALRQRPERAGRALHLRHLHRAVELPAPHDVAPRQPRAARNGHLNPPTLAVAAEQSITCCVCGEEFYGPGAEDLAFNSGGACPELRRHGRGARPLTSPRLFADPTLSLDEGAVAPWRQPHVVAHEPGGRRDGRAHRRALPGSDRRRGAGHRAARPHGEDATSCTCPRAKTTPPSWTSPTTAP